MIVHLWPHSLIYLGRGQKMAEYQNILQDPIKLSIIKTHLADNKSDIKVKKKSDIKNKVRAKESKKKWER